MDQGIQNSKFAKELSIAVEASQLGREILLRYFGNLSQVEEKDQAGLVSEADRESEEAICSHIRGAFADHFILGEESGLSKGDGEKRLQDLDSKNLSNQSIWLIDPLDGTTNYVHQFPVFCISIGFMHDGEMVVAVVDAPMLNQTFTAVKGQGAFLNGKRINCSERKSVDTFLLGTGFAISKKKEIDGQVETFRQILHSTRGVRRAGAAAYDLCLVAQGVFDGFWEKNLSPWDTAAGSLLVTEAGGVVSNFSGEIYSPFMDDVLATSSSAQSFLYKKLNQ